MKHIFRSLAEVRAAHKAAGGHWFDRRTMRSFGSVIETKLIRNRYFISSELSFCGEDRAFSIREVSDAGSIKTVGEFRQYLTLADARGALLDLVRTRKSAR
jgi:hypothetical protein